MAVIEVTGQGLVESVVVVVVVIVVGGGWLAVGDWPTDRVHFFVGVVALEDGLRLFEAGLEGVQVGLILEGTSCCCCCVC